jgi:hypothetical protein
MNEFLRRWNRWVAQQRIHGSTRRQVLTHFLEVEKPAMQLPSTERFELFELGTRTVHPVGYIELDSAYYTAPHHLVGQRLRVRWDERLVRLYHQGQLVRLHSKQHHPGVYTTCPDDRPAHKPARQEAYQPLSLSDALANLEPEWPPRPSASTTPTPSHTAGLNTQSRPSPTPPRPPQPPRLPPARRRRRWGHRSHRPARALPGTL